MATIAEAEAIGWALLEAGNYARAQQVYQQIVLVDPLAVQAWFLLGAVEQVGGRIDEAVRCYRQVLSLKVDHAEAWNNLGLALQGQGSISGAVAHYREALCLNPDYADAHNNLGNVLKDQGELSEAVTHYRNALRLRPGYGAALNNLANALQAEGRLAEAVELYDRALELKPDHAEMHLNRALAWLQMGDFARGWSEFEWRWQCPEYVHPTYPQPLWDGAPLAGRTILLHAEHGLGDTIQFVRYAPLVEARGGRVIVACPRPLARLLTACPGVAQTVAEGDPLPEFEVHVPMMSLPRIFGTTVDTIPVEMPYLCPNPGLVAQWRGVLDMTGTFKVGIAWQGNPRYKKDRQRSFRLAHLAPLARVEGVRLISLQKGLGTEQLTELAGAFEVIDLDGRLDDLENTAAVMKNLDLVITPDTALAHLAGSLDIPSWVALSFAPDWRWLPGRDDSPWYPSIRLFRQEQPGDWDEVFERMAAMLAMAG